MLPLLSQTRGDTTDRMQWVCWTGRMGDLSSSVLQVSVIWGTGTWRHSAPALPSEASLMPGPQGLSCPHCTLLCWAGDPSTLAK